MAARHEASTAERVKSFLWFAGIAVLFAAAVILWIRKATAPAPSLLERSTQLAEQQRATRLVEQLQVAVKLTQDADPQRRREGLTQIEQMAQQNPTFLPGREMLVRAALLSNETATADRAARELVKEYPEAVESHTLLGLVSLAMRQLPTAEEEIKKAIELNKQHEGKPQWNLHGLLAETYMREGRLQEADAELRRAADIDLPQAVVQIAQSSIDLSERLGVLLLQSGKPQELEAAYVLLTGVARHAPDDPEAQYHAAASAFRKGRLDEARTFLATAERLKPGDPRFAQLQAEIARGPTTTRATAGLASQPGEAATKPAQ